MTSEEKERFWQHHIEGWRQSRLSQKVYCKANNLSFASFGYWRTRLNRKSKVGKKLIPMTLPRSAGSVAMFLPEGIRLEVPVHALAEVLVVIRGREQKAS